MMAEAPSENMPSERRLAECPVCGYPTPTPPTERCPECGTVFAAELARRTEFLLGSRKFVYAGGVILILLLLAVLFSGIHRGWEEVPPTVFLSFMALGGLWLHTTKVEPSRQMLWGATIRCGIPITIMPTAFTVLGFYFVHLRYYGTTSRASGQMGSAFTVLFAVVAASMIAIMVHVWPRHGFQWFSRAGAGVVMRLFGLFLTMILLWLFGSI
jgi:hypothetical protein